MQVLLRTDNYIKSGEGLVSLVESTVEDALHRWANQVTTVQVRISDANGPKKGDNDKRCMMEARLGGLQPISASHDAATVADAIDGAADKLKRTIDRHVGKLDDHKGNMPFGGEPGV
jgi:ribosome-associated translation inhibitor RaiA